MTTIAARLYHAAHRQGATEKSLTAQVVLTLHEARQLDALIADLCPEEETCAHCGKRICSACEVNAEHTEQEGVEVFCNACHGTRPRNCRHCGTRTTPGLWSMCGLQHCGDSACLNKCRHCWRELRGL